MILNQHPNTGLVSVLLVLLVAGLITGLAISNTDLLNPNSSAAEARVRDLETQVLYHQAEIDLAYYRALQDQKLIAGQRELDQNLRLAELTRYVVLGTGGLSLLIVSTGLTTLLVLYGRSRLAYPNTPPASAAGNWQDPDWRAEQVRLARERAHKTRQNDLTQPMATEVNAGGNGKIRSYS